MIDNLKGGDGKWLTVFTAGTLATGTSNSTYLGDIKRFDFSP